MNTSGGGHEDRDPSGAEEAIVAEARWPMAAAVVTAMVLTILLPSEIRLIPAWVAPSLEGMLLLALIVGDPGAIDRRSQTLRSLSIALVSLLVLSALVATVRLIDALVHGSTATNSANELLAVGGIVFLSNIIAFALLYWELDSGGAAARAHGLSKSPDFAFPEQLSPDVAPPNWRPRFFDYLYLGYTNAVAFSPTDAMPLALWAKGAMAIQSGISLVILGLVIARAVNVLT